MFAGQLLGRKSVCLCDVPCSHVFPVMARTEQGLSETTCSSVSGDYLFCPRHCQIIKHLRPLSSCSLPLQSLGFITVTPGCVAVQACLFNVIPRQLTEAFIADTSQYFTSKLLYTSILIQKDSCPPSLFTALMIPSLELIQQIMKNEVSEGKWDET